MQGNYAAAYSGNEIIYSAIEMLATSAGEPHMLGTRYRRGAPTVRNEQERLQAAGLPHRAVKERLITNGFVEPLPNHPLVALLERPNPWMTRAEMWGTVVMDEALAGNSYWLKVRAEDGPLKGAVAELWRLRPDRVRIKPSATQFVEGYEYRAGQNVVTYRADDIVQFKTRNPQDDYYGLPTLVVLAGRLAIDNYMKAFLRNFYESGGIGPGAVLTLEGSLTSEQRTAIEERSKQYRGVHGMEKWLVLDNTRSTFQHLGLNRGLRDALPKELDAVSEARIAMVFGIPGSILGLLIGYESSSYANKRQDWQVFWDLTMTPKLKKYDDELNMQLTPDFGGIDAVQHDLSDIRALQEDVDKLHARFREDWLATAITHREYREALGLNPEPGASEIVIVPSNMKAIRVSELGEEPELVAPPALPASAEEPSPNGAAPVAALNVVEIVAEVNCPECGRWVGRNMNVGATAFCPKCKEVRVGAQPGIDTKAASVVP